MNVEHVVGILLIAICAIRGFKKGFVNTLGTILASLLAIVFVYLLNTWALESLLLTLLADHMLVVVRIVLCVVLYIALFFLLKAMILSLRVLAKLPIVRGLNKLLGFIVGAAYGILLVGIIFAFFV
ncbi:MAG: hypothetical protein E7289_09580 [Lachnospiraceae bacterium]|nr:hypothetical protein [Lachnospiraceae bacterium]